MLNTLLTPLIWLTNGLLVILYALADHFLALAVFGLLGVFTWRAPQEQQPWAAAASALALIATFIAPAPVPLFLLVMAGAGWAALALEKYNVPAQRWNVVRGIALYALAGLGFAVYSRANISTALLSDPMTAQGAVYLNALIAISMYVIPLGFLAWIAQSVWAHPPGVGSPEQIIGKVRSRGRD